MNKNLAFTLAEVLITLGVIGIVAAMTLPQLIKNYQHKVLETQFKKSVSIISQNILRMKEDLSLNYLAETCTIYSNGEYVYSKMCSDAFYKNLVKLSGGKAAPNKLFQYDLDRTEEKILTFNRKQVVTQTAMAAAGRPIFYVRELPDGSFLNMTIGSNAVIGADINGQKGPNQLGHDIFLFILDKKNDTLTYTKPQNLSDEEIANGNYEEEYQEARAGNPCNISSSQKANGIGCAYYALRDECPDGSGRKYFECLP